MVPPARQCKGARTLPTLLNVRNALDFAPAAGSGNVTASADLRDDALVFLPQARVQSTAVASDWMKWTPGTTFRLSRWSLVMNRSTPATEAQASWTASGGRMAPSRRTAAKA